VAHVADDLAPRGRTGEPRIHDHFSDELRATREPRCCEVDAALVTRLEPALLLPPAASSAQGAELHAGSGITNIDARAIFLPVGAICPFSPGPRNLARACGHASSGSGVHASVGSGNHRRLPVSQLWYMGIKAEQVQDMPDKDWLSELTGQKFLKRIQDHELRCARVTRRLMPKLGKKLPDCYERLGMTLALLDCAACCYWGCAQGDHRLEFLLGGGTNTAYAALDLARRGYYDQALSLARTLGELSNLLGLFVLDGPRLERWKTVGERARTREFSAVKVRLALADLNVPVPTDEDRYRQLSGYSIHATPDRLPQAHNPHGQPLTFSVFQESGLFMSINEIARSVAFIAYFSSYLLDLHKDVRKTLNDIARALLEAVGGVTTDAKGRPWFKLN
jgi:hypothetical protein